jgi:hypothetical protein
MPINDHDDHAGQGFHGQPQQALREIMQRLKQHRYANVHSAIARRAMRHFTLQADDTPTEANDLVHLLVYPQNPFISEPEVRRLPAKDVGKGLINSRITISDSRGITAQPDEDGHYLYAPNTPEFDLVNAFYYATFTLRMIERYAHRVIPYSFPAPRLRIDPHVGNQANAFYSEQDQMLGFHTYTLMNGEERSTAQSADIVTHEMAHAVLDGMRDLYNESFGLGSRAFHESFGDITAMLVALHDDSLIQRLLDWTKGDLRTSNFVSEIAEQLAANLYDDEHIAEHSSYLRNAFNNLKADDFDDLPYIPKDPVANLGRQEHNYSRLFTGAIYDIFVGVYEALREDHYPVIAIHRARDVVGHLIILAIELAPVGEFDFADMARALLSADAIHCGGCFRDVLAHVFDDRAILSTLEVQKHLNELSSLPDVTLPASINHALASAQFLEETLLPALNIQPERELIPLSTYRNSEGQAFMTFYEIRSLQLNGDTYGNFNGSTVDLFGGLTVMFDADERLRSVCYRPVTAEDMRQIEIIIAELMAYNRIANALYPVEQPIRPLPEALHLGADVIGAAKLVKYPVIFDALPESVQPFEDYLQKVKDA